MRRLLIVIMVLLVVPGTAWAGGGGHMSQCAGFATGTTVSMLDSCFEGTAHFAPAGETVTITNDGAMPHTFTAVDGSFDTGRLEAGDSYEISVDEPGIIEVFCTLHGTAEGTGMAGVLVVGEAEPLPVSAPANLSVIKEAVADENQSLADVVESQGALIAALTSAQSNLTDVVEAHADETGEDDEAAAAAAGEPPVGAGSPWAMVAAGAAGGLVLAVLGAGLFLRLRARGPLREGMESPLEA